MNFVFTDCTPVTLRSKSNSRSNTPSTESCQNDLSSPATSSKQYQSTLTPHKPTTYEKEQVLDKRAEQQSNEEKSGRKKKTAIKYGVRHCSGCHGVASYGHSALCPAKDSDFECDGNCTWFNCPTRKRDLQNKKANCQAKSDDLKDLLRNPEDFKRICEDLVKPVLLKKKNSLLPDPKKRKRTESHRNTIDIGSDDDVDSTEMSSSQRKAAETLKLLEEGLEKEEDVPELGYLLELTKKHEQRIAVLERALSLLAQRVGVTGKFDK
jgi:hypothetical protein